MSDEDVLHRIQAAAACLYYPSESDAPLLAYRYPGDDEPTAEDLLAAEGLPPETPVVVQTLEDFFEGLTNVGQSASPADLAEAAEWRALQETLERELSDLRVYWVGQVDLDAFVLGQAPSGAWLGLRTHAVET